MYVALLCKARWNDGRKLWVLCIVYHHVEAALYVLNRVIPNTLMGRLCVVSLCGYGDIGYRKSHITWHNDTRISRIALYVS